MRYVISVSGGKDSVAMWLYLRRTMPRSPDLVPVYQDTGWEWKEIELVKPASGCARWGICEVKPDDA